jgi:hypothetical protein
MTRALISTRVHDEDIAGELIDESESFEHLKLEPVRTYMGEWTCLNCNHKNISEIPHSIRIADAELTCSRCGCY